MIVKCNKFHIIFKNMPKGTFLWNREKGGKILQSGLMIVNYCTVLIKFSKLGSKLKFPLKEYLFILGKFLVFLHILVEQNMRIKNVIYLLKKLVKKKIP